MFKIELHLTYQLQDKTTRKVKIKCYSPVPGILLVGEQYEKQEKHENQQKIGEKFEQPSHENMLHLSKKKFDHVSSLEVTCLAIYFLVSLCNDREKEQKHSPRLQIFMGDDQQMTLGSL